ncbi:ATP-dependent DNA ligase [Jatrophihabitans sp.]|uniref:ATP-dependent DNA ligase n=1 Tax=Jatrophihabitans sp. TaxID=1932789 RepID=UPI002B92E487|nr:ATP-dependent DNA ligase [Jatrophihabitans sp.]
MQFFLVTATSDELAATPARGAKVAKLAALLRGSSGAEAVTVVSWLSGELTQRQIGVGWGSLRSLPPPAPQPSLDVAAVEAALTEIGGCAGPGSQARRRQLLEALFAAATESEQRFLVRLLTGDLRQGALAGVMADAVARAADLPIAQIRRAAMLSASLPAVAAAALDGGSEALAGFRLRVGQPVSPMLAQTATSTADALERLGGTAAFEWKLDGIRVQVHRNGDDVRIFTRGLEDVTGRFDEITAAVRGVAAEEFVADGELMALRGDGRPQPFQVTAGRVGTLSAPAVGSPELGIFLFDILQVEGTDLLDEPGDRRAEVLAGLVPAAARIPRLVTADPAEAEAFLADALAHGQEGVVAKSLTAPYEAGRRGAGWLKIKPVHTLDLVVLAVEWGSGRRRGTLSNIHLGARDPRTGGFVMLGKTFKGMTDAILDFQTRRFLELADGPTDSYVVRVRPEQVVEIAFDGVQRSSRYPGKVALRFARVLRYRDDKTADEADTIDTVLALAAAAGLDSG